MEDHAADETRHACRSRPYAALGPADASPMRNVLKGHSNIEIVLAGTQRTSERG